MRQEIAFQINDMDKNIIIISDTKIAEVVIPGRIINKKNHRVPTPIPVKTSNFYYFFKKMGMTPVRVGNVPSSAYKKWEKATRIYFNDKYRDIKPTDKDVLVELKVFYKGPQPDLSGSMESIGDCFEGYLWVNDKQIKMWASSLYHDKRDPRVEVAVYLLETKK